MKSDVRLLLSEIHINRNAIEVEMLSQFVFDESSIRVFHILWKVCKENKLRHRGRQLSAEFNLYVLSFGCWRRIVFNNRKHHFVELVRWDTF